MMMISFFLMCLRCLDLR